MKNIAHGPLSVARLSFVPTVEPFGLAMACTGQAILNVILIKICKNHDLS